MTKVQEEAGNSGEQQKIPLTLEPERAGGSGRRSGGRIQAAEQVR